MLGRFVMEERKLPYYVVPDLTGFNVRVRFSDDPM